MNLDRRKVNFFLEQPEVQKRFGEFGENRMCYPLQTVLHLTTECNHKCNFCSNDYRIRQVQVHHIIDSDYAVRLIEELSEVGVRNLIISGGGEPLIHPWAKQILDKAINSNMDFFLYTNLDLNLSPHLLESLATIKNPIGVNINTLNEKLYHKTRGEWAHLGRVRDNIRKLRERSARLNAIVILRDDTAPYLEKTLEGLLAEGFEGITVSPAFKIPYADRISVSNLTIEEMKRIKKKINSPKVRILEPVEKPACLDGKIFCKSFYFDITIGADYWIYPCCISAYDLSRRLMNLKSYASFKEAWESNTQKLSQFRPVCGPCWFSPLNRKILERWPTNK